MKICLLTIATGNYWRFLPVLRASLRRRFLVGHELHHLLFTDREISPSEHLHVVRIEHESWPLPTLRRYEHFCKAGDFIRNHDYCFYLDADMRVDRPVGTEILGELVATRHPYQSFLPPAQMTFERDPRSAACVGLDEGRMYYAGGFNGGTPAAFLTLAETLATAIARDRAAGITARWHDESHLNRYLVDHPPTVSLSPSYCYPEEWYEGGPPAGDEPLVPRIVALRKQHAVVRGPATDSAAAITLDPPRTDRPAVSVVLCTWNPRREVLSRVLESLARQTLAAAEWELVVVDNASYPPVEVALPAGCEIQCRTVVEPVVGLAAARIRGIREARGELLVFVDDDNVLDADYLAEAVAIAETRPDLGAFGGRTSPDFEGDPPAWLRPFYSHLALVECDRDAWSSKTYPNDVLPCGAGMCVRRSLTLAWANDVAADPRRLALGRTGATPLGAEDADLALSCIDRGHATGRFTALHLTHVIPARRLEFDYQVRLAHDLGASYGRLLAMRGDLTLGRRLRIQGRTILGWLGLKHRGPARAIDLAYYQGFLAGAATATATRRGHAGA